MESTQPRSKFMRSCTFVPNTLLLALIAFPRFKRHTHTHKTCNTNLHSPKIAERN
ncbi:hypothetical protein CROQUDRAFT_661127 [Cronartium quercuum f. sp. fusiforme G11]|uniref:Uncharacterized protein n=1 Tax=Cronartium quercuum f. sp. fusiforme G11 TaxID=708437 RepID=A0A9P6NGC3_9BASI|nr:hypothetical protein CROQUDRAFT_661127 [Cronartium quercuum f. sp. fusiforme G11]